MHIHVWQCPTFFPGLCVYVFGVGCLDVLIKTTIVYAVFT